MSLSRAVFGIAVTCDAATAALATPPHANWAGRMQLRGLFQSVNSGNLFSQGCSVDALRDRQVATAKGRVVSHAHRCSERIAKPISHDARAARKPERRESQGREPKECRPPASTSANLGCSAGQDNQNKKKRPSCGELGSQSVSRDPGGTVAGATLEESARFVARGSGSTTYRRLRGSKSGG